MISLSKIICKTSLDIDTYMLLRHLMYLPKGYMKLRNIKAERYVAFQNDPRIILNHCHQNAYIELDEESIQLTECGLTYYLESNNSAEVW